MIPEQYLALARMSKATVYTNRHYPLRPVVSFSHEAWLEFCKKVEGASRSDTSPVTVPKQQVEQEPAAWTNPRALEWSKCQSEKVVKLTCKAQPEYDFTEPLYTRPQPHTNEKPMAEIWWDDSKDCDWQLKMLVEPAVARGVRIPLYAGDYETMSVMHINQDGSFTVKAPNEEIE